jgi:hypothetical protein
MSNSRRTPDDWHAIGQFWTQMAFAMCLVGATFGVIYCLIFVTQPMVGQAKNDAVLFEILKTVLTSMISIIGTLMAVGHGSNASTPPAPPKPPVPPVPPVPQVPAKPLSNPSGTP